MFKIPLLFIFLVFLLKHKVAYAKNWPTQRYSEPNVYLQGFAIESFKVNTIFECYRKCEENIHCASINMDLADKTCELKHSTKTRQPHSKSSKPHTVYMEVRDALGSTPHNPILSCKWFKSLGSQVESGVYWMKFNESSSAPFQVFCDMTTDGGGWTLVYSYTFTKYNAFLDNLNAVTPIPNWAVDRSVGTWVPESTTTPLGESSRSAMDFALWKKIGNEFLVKSNITNWVACVEGTGSLVNWVAGSLSCRLVKAITPTCTDVVPNQLVLHECGPLLLVDGKFMFHFEGSTNTQCDPAHSSCGDIHDHLTNVPNPGGAGYVR